MKKLIVCLFVLVAISSQPFCWGQEYKQRIRVGSGKDLSTLKGIATQILGSLADKYEEKVMNYLGPGYFELAFDVWGNRRNTYGYAYSVKLMQSENGIDGVPWKVSKSGRFITVRNENAKDWQLIQKMPYGDAPGDSVYLSGIKLEAKSEAHASLIFKALVALFDAEATFPWEH